jgi:hypothetical protein
MDRHFIDTQQIFGATTAAANFDEVASTVLDLAKSESNTPGVMIHRTLDDVAAVCPADKDWNKQFTDTYKRLATKINVQLTEECPNKEKAFTDSTFGTVLGVIFDTDRLSWKIPEHKTEGLLQDMTLTS